MVDYVEFPVDLLTKVVLPKKDDGGGGPPDGGEQGPCGAYLSSGRPVYGIMSPQDDGLWVLQTTIQGGVNVVCWVAVPHVTGDGSYNSSTDYLWANPNGFTVSVTPGIFYTGDWAVKVWRNADPQTFNPCTTPGFTLNHGGATIEKQQPTEQYPPIFFLTAVGAPGAESLCESFPNTFSVQGLCKEQTEGGLPPQPPNYSPITATKIKIIGPVLPGSIFN